MKKHTPYLSEDLSLFVSVPTQKQLMRRKIKKALSPFVERAKRYNSDMMLFVLNDMVASFAEAFDLDADLLKKECGL